MHKNEGLLQRVWCLVLLITKSFPLDFWSALNMLSALQPPRPPPLATDATCSQPWHLPLP